MADRSGILLVNLGSPASPDLSDVRAYLREFLSDPFVMDLPAPARWILLHLVILPFRPKKSAAAYRSIWTKRGSPLVVATAELAQKLQDRLDERAAAPGVAVRYAMRYGSPSIEEALQAFRETGIFRIHAVPLYPQFAGATTGTVMRTLYAAARKDPWRPFSVSVESPFFERAGFAELWAVRIRQALSQHGTTANILFSFHGLPVRQIHRSGDGCLREGCCDKTPFHCYRAQCLATARAIGDLAGLPPERWTVSFQSRMGRDEWLAPATEDRIRELAARAAEPVLLVPLSFVADCLETLEELQIRGREVFESARTSPEARLVVLPSLNADDDWVDFLYDLVAKKV